MLARQTLEYAVLMNAKEQKLEEFERNMAHLQTLYDSYGCVPPAAPPPRSTNWAHPPTTHPLVSCDIFGSKPF